MLLILPTFILLSCDPVSDMEANIEKGLILVAHFLSPH